MKDKIKKPWWVTAGQQPDYVNAKVEETKPKVAHQPVHKVKSHKK